MNTEIAKTSISSNSAPMSSVVLIADAFQQSGIQQFERLGCKVFLDPTLKERSLVEAIAQYKPEILIVRSTKVSADMMDAANSLSMIIRAGAGYDTIDIKAASARGISVANCPGKNSIAVAELAWGLILSCDRRIPDQTKDLRDGIWDKKKYSIASGLYGRTLGVVGLGGIGAEVVNRAKAFGMRIAVWSRSMTVEKAEVLGAIFCSTLNELAEKSDVVSVHVASTAETEHIIDSTFFDSMKDGAIFINTSRGQVVDEKALSQAVHRKNIRAGLDVYEDEPSSGASVFSGEVISHEGVYGTHHVGASTDQAQEAIAEEAVHILSTFIREGAVLNCVNLAVEPTVDALLAVRHKNLPGVLAHVFQILSQSGINVEEMENTLYEGEFAACARIQLSGIPAMADIDSIKQNKNILSVMMTMQ